MKPCFSLRGIAPIFLALLMSIAGGVQAAESGDAPQTADTASQQARIEELRARIEALNNETISIESRNRALREAVDAAETLTTMLSEESRKYGDTDPATGEAVEDLAGDALSELSADLERLREEARNTP